MDSVSKFTTFSRWYSYFIGVDDAGAKYYKDPENRARLTSQEPDILKKHSRTREFKNAISFSTEVHHNASVISSANTPVYYFRNKKCFDDLNELFGLASYKASGFLPPGLVSCSKNVVIFEVPPMKKVVSYVPTARDNINSDIVKLYLVDKSIPVPWQIYVAIFNNDYRLIDTYMFYSKNSIISFGVDQDIYTPALPNFYSNGMLCRPFYGTNDDVNRYSEDLSGVISAAYDSVWNSGWNSDLIDSLIDAMWVGKHTYYKDFQNPLREKVPVLFDRYANAISCISYGSKSKAFSIYADAVSEFDLDQISKTYFGNPSRYQTWERDVEAERDRLVSDYTESYSSDSDDSELEDYLEQNMNVNRMNAKTFRTVINDIINFSAKENLTILGSSNMKHQAADHFSKIINQKA